ncbi:Axin interactor dorsalization-associated protein N-terminal [Dioscorea alata]|uniref:Axin interactor dorsalization-associated protein N-terminal n=3 Tax=Dioscorea alata TaxID=55571 RepID=A0ACB7VE56_DIOAL|nr:Axin interactor dorsalization-associated protein N-terminal [Dioscorea alata]
MDDSGAILSQISAYKDLLDEVNEEIEQNIQKTREIESEIVKCLEVEKDSVTKESDLLKMLSMRDFELSGLVQIAATSRNSCESLACDLRLLQMNKDETIKRISQKRDQFLLVSSQFQAKTLSAENKELTFLLSEKETLEKEKDTLNMKIDALQNSTKECLGEILEEIQISNSALDIDIEHGISENKVLLNDMRELKILLSSMSPSEEFSS